MNPIASSDSRLGIEDSTAANAESSNTANSNTNSNNDHLLPQSQLGTKEYWEAIYERDLDNYGDHGDEGEIW